MFIYLIAGSGCSFILAMAFARKAIKNSEDYKPSFALGVGFALSFGCTALFGVMAAVQRIPAEDNETMEAQQKYLIGREQPLAEFRKLPIQTSSN